MYAGSHGCIDHILARMDVQSLELAQRTMRKVSSRYKHFMDLVNNSVETRLRWFYEVLIFGTPTLWLANLGRRSLTLNVALKPGVQSVTSETENVLYYCDRL